MQLFFRLILLTVCTVTPAFSQTVQTFLVAAHGSNISAVAENKPKYSLTDEKVRDVAQLITVRVYSVEPQEWEKGTIEATSGSGSGILIDRQEIPEQNGYLYLVLTNNHVLREPKEYQTYVKTHDGLLHQAFVHQEANSEFSQKDVDLGLIWFYSPRKYQPAKQEESHQPIATNTKIFIAGFPCSETSLKLECPAEYTITKGQGDEVDKPLNQGYQIFFNNETKEGTSGGPILNPQGRVIGVNGRGPNTPNSRQYQYADGSEVPQKIRDQSPGLGIPIRTYHELAPKEPLNTIKPPDGIENKPIYYLQSLEQEGANNEIEITLKSISDIWNDKIAIVILLLFIISVLAFLFLLVWVIARSRYILLTLEKNLLTLKKLNEDTAVIIEKERSRSSDKSEKELSREEDFIQDSPILSESISFFSSVTYAVVSEIELSILSNKLEEKEISREIDSTQDCPILSDSTSISRVTYAVDINLLIYRED